MRKSYQTDTTVFDELLKKWPSSIVSRSELERLTGGVLKGRYMANLEARGDERALPKFRVGKKVFYRLDDIISYLKRESARHAT
jgi:hypothetical protein